MPFKSEKQRRYLWANEPEVAQRWSDEYGSKPRKRKKKSSLLDAFIEGGRKMNR